MADAWQVAPGDDSGQWDTHPRDDGPDHDDETPIVSSPSIAADWQTSVDHEVADRDREADWPSIARYDGHQGEAARQSGSPFRNLLKPPRFGASEKPLISFTTVCAGMGALALNVNRNKRGAALDLRQAGGREALLRLLGDSVAWYRSF